MKVLILGAGYGTRLQQDVQIDVTGRYAHLLGLPKALLPVGDIPLITHWLNVFKNYNKMVRPPPDAASPEFPSIGLDNSVYIVTNNTYYGQFIEWAGKEHFPVHHIVNNGTSSNETRLGAIGDIQFAIAHFNIRDDLLIVAGDTLFFSDFSFYHFVETTIMRNGCHVNSYTLGPNDSTLKYGILELDQSNQVVGFLEKPHPDTTSSRTACPCFYFFKEESLPFIEQFLEDKRSIGAPLADYDAPGRFIEYLHPRFPVFANPISGRFDVGGLETYIKADWYYRNQLNGHVGSKDHA